MTSSGDDGCVCVLPRRAVSQAGTSAQPFSLPLGDNGVVVILEEFETKTGGRLDALDVTDDVRRVVGSSGIRSGTALIFSPHTTCSVFVTVAGKAAVESIQQAMESIAPDGAYYAHDDLAIRTENLVEE